MDVGGNSDGFLKEQNFKTVFVKMQKLMKGLLNDFVF